MTKKLKIVFAIVTIAIFLVTLFVFAFSINVSPNSLMISNIQVTDSSVSFDYIQRDSGYFLKSYKYDVDSNGTLTLKFKGTIFSFLSLKNKSNRITIDDVQNVKKIVISNSTQTVDVWQYENN